MKDLKRIKILKSQYEVLKKIVDENKLLSMTSIDSKTAIYHMFEEFFVNDVTNEYLFLQRKKNFYYLIRTGIYRNINLSGKKIRRSLRKVSGI